MLWQAGVFCYRDTMSDFIHTQGLIWLPHILRRLSNRFVEACDLVFPKFGIIVPPNMVSTIHLLHERGPQPVMAIAALTTQSHPLINKYVKQLKALGLVETGADAKDGRRTIVSLTAAGEEQARRLVAVRAEFVPAYEALLTEAQADIFEPLWQVEAALKRRDFADRIMTISDRAQLPPGDVPVASASPKKMN